MPLKRLESIDLVEDSEPEREALRETLKKSKRPTKRLVTRPTTGVRQVIELSSSDEATKPTTAKVHDLSDSESASDASTSGQPTTGLETTTGPLTVAPATTTSHPAPTPPVAPGPALNQFARFSYIAPPNHRAKSTESLPERAQRTSAQPRKPKKKATHRFADEFSDTELSKIARCVACSLKWTAKKTGAQKMTHILSCSAKKSFNDETIRVLIQKELDLIVKDELKEEQLAASKVEPETYLEDVLKVVAPKKRGRRQKVTETIQGIDTESRKQILNKAQMILGPSSSRTTQLPDNEVTKSTEPPTQNFGQSSLAQRYGGTALAFSSGLTQPLASTSINSGSESDSEPPPATQPFGPSRLAQQAGPSRLVQASTGEAIDISDESFGSQDYPHPHLESDLSPQLEMRSLQSTPVPDSPMSIREEYEDAYFGMDDGVDECFLHFEPRLAGEPLEDSGNDMFRIPSPPLANDNVIPNATPGPSRPRAKRKSLDLTPAKPTPKPRVSSTPKSPLTKTATTKTKKKKRKSRSPSDDADEALWEHLMKGIIMRDEELYCRIIRYEPIHFGVFVALAGIEEPCPAKERTRLRKFLDKQAIHFYGSEPQPRGGRRRRSRSKTKTGS